MPGTPCTQGVLQYTFENGLVKARIIVNGLFGWIALGLENEGGAHNGMNGASIVMGLPGSPAQYSPKTGLSVTGTTTRSVDEYTIHPQSSAFRHWSTPHGSAAITAAVIETTSCYTSMSFTTNTIAGRKLAVDGTINQDKLIWGFNDQDHFVGYHGSSNRGKVTVDWSCGSTGGCAPQGTAIAVNSASKSAAVSASTITAMAIAMMLAR